MKHKKFALSLLLGTFVMLVASVPMVVRAEAAPAQAKAACVIEEPTDPVLNSMNLAPL